MTQDSKQYKQVWVGERYFWYNPTIGMWWDGRSHKPTSSRKLRSHYRKAAIAHKYHPSQNGYPSRHWELQREELWTETITTTIEAAVVKDCIKERDLEC